MYHNANNRMRVQFVENSISLGYHWFSLIQIREVDNFSCSDLEELCNHCSVTFFTKAFYEYKHKEIITTSSKDNIDTLNAMHRARYLPNKIAHKNWNIEKTGDPTLYQHRIILFTISEILFSAARAAFKNLDWYKNLTSINFDHTSPVQLFLLLQIWYSILIFYHNVLISVKALPQSSTNF